MSSGGEAVGGRQPCWTIGEVARSARLTVTALRHYHEAGVLVPARVDPVTRYRYYTEEQVTAALRIGLLRETGVPLRDLRALADGHLGLEETLERQRDRLRREIGVRRRALALLDALAPGGPGGSPPTGPVEGVLDGVRDGVVAADEVDFLWVDASWATVAASTRRGLVRLALAQRRAGRAVGGEPGAIFPLDPTDRFRLRVFRSGSGPVPAGVARGRLPDGPALVVHLRGDHALLPLAYRAALAEASRRGLAPAGNVVERYLRVTDEPPFTRILLPVAPA